MRGRKVNERTVPFCCMVVCTKTKLFIILLCGVRVYKNKIKQKNKNKNKNEKKKLLLFGKYQTKKWIVNT